MRGLAAAVGRASRGCSHCSRGNPSACIAKCSLSCVCEGESECEHPVCVGKAGGGRRRDDKGTPPLTSPQKIRSAVKLYRLGTPKAPRLTASSVVSRRACLYLGSATASTLTLKPLAICASVSTLATSRSSCQYALHTQHNTAQHRRVGLEVGRSTIKSTGVVCSRSTCTVPWIAPVARGLARRAQGVARRQCAQDGASSTAVARQVGLLAAADQLPSRGVWQSS